MKSNIYQLFATATIAASKTIVIALAFVASLQGEVAAQNFRLVKDINTSTDGNPANYNYIRYNNYSGFAILNGINYFSADDGLNGVGLWRSDGTAAGTYQVKSGINPSNIVASNGKLIFRADGNPSLWKSDGTTAGTVPVLNVVPPGLGNFNPEGLTDLNGTVFFAISGTAIRSELWKTDGTAAGTVLVKNLYSAPGSPTSGFSIFDITPIKNKIYFSAYGADYKYLLWVSDGTAAGTFKISDNLYDPAQLIERSADPSDQFVYFTAATQQNGSRTLCVTNGQAGVAGVAAGFSGIASGNYFGNGLINRNGFLYFVGRASTLVPNESVYRFDITGNTGVQAVKTVTGTGSGNSPSYPSNLVERNGNIYFNVYDAINQRSQFWKTDGTSAGSILVKDSFSVQSIFDAYGTTFISGQSSAGVELWKSDGTPAGTVLIKDIFPGKESSTPRLFGYASNKVLFSATDGNNGNELWLSDGTAAGTSLLKDFNQTTTASSNPFNLLAFNNKLVFSGYNYNFTGRDNLFISDGSSSGTNLVSDTVSKSSQDFAIKDSFLYFWGYSVAGIGGLYKSNGTSAGTTLVKSFNGIPVSFNGMLTAGSLVYFYLYNGSTFAQELWRSDGTAANTYVIRSGSLSSDKKSFCALGNALFFADGSGLWKTDGTAAGTVLLKSLSSVTKLVAGDGILFFSAFDGTNSIWKTDGTTAGTVRVTANVTNAAPLLYSKNNLFFTGTGATNIYGDLGNELYKTDGTANGTFLVKDIAAGSASSSVESPVHSNGNIYFTTYGNSGVELWKSNGTDTGTSLVVNLGSNGPNGMVVCNGKLFFVISNYANQTVVLWESDGTAAGTHAVTDNGLSGLKLDANTLTAVGNQLFLTATNYQFGKELYVGDISGPPTNDSFSLCPNGSGGITSSLVGLDYQWQIKSDTASAFINLKENGVFSGVTTSSLQVKNIPSTYSGAKFRCQVNGNTFSKITTLTFAVNWTGNVNGDWSNTGNWGCGGSLPDANTDVVINYGQAVVITSGICKTIYVRPGASVVVNTGSSLSVKGTSQTVKHTVGESYLGGIVFFVDSSNHGLICSPQDIGAYPWDLTIFDFQNYNPPFVNATGTANGTGFTNTSIIASQLGTGNYAASKCRQYTGGGYNGWYLPSKDELNLIYKNLKLSGLAIFSTGNNPYYWSSSEIDNKSVWIQKFDDGVQNNFTWKNNVVNVRAVRSF